MADVPSGNQDVKEKLKVLLVDDHTLFRMGLAELLERSNIEVIASTGDGLNGIRLAKELQPDVILLDLRMPEINGMAVLRELRKQSITVPVAMLTTSSEERDLVEALRSGAQGYLLKDMEPDQLVNALSEIVQGKTVVAPELTGVLARIVQGAPQTNSSTEGFGELTKRELEILCYLAEGRSNKVIAKILGISDGTVKLHVKAVLRKLAVHSRVEAAVIAVEHGMCDRSL